MEFKVKDREERLTPVPHAHVTDLEARRKANQQTRFIIPGNNGQTNGHMLQKLKKVALHAGLNCGHCTSKIGQSCASIRYAARSPCPRSGAASLLFILRLGCALIHCGVGWDTAIWRYLAVADVHSEAVRAQVESTFSSWAVSGTPVSTPRDQGDANSR